jgi:hypothetical protein
MMRPSRTGLYGDVARQHGVETRVGGGHYPDVELHSPQQFVPNGGRNDRLRGAREQCRQVHFGRDPGPQDRDRPPHQAVARRARKGERGVHRGADTCRIAHPDVRRRRLEPVAQLLSAEADKALQRQLAAPRFGGHVLDGGPVPGQEHYSAGILQAVGDVAQVQRCFLELQPSVKLGPGPQSSHRGIHRGLAGCRQVGVEVAQDAQVDAAADAQVVGVEAGREVDPAGYLHIRVRAGEVPTDHPD